MDERRAVLTENQSRVVSEIKNRNRTEIVNQTNIIDTVSIFDLKWCDFDFKIKLN